MTARPSRPRGARAGRVVFGSAGLAGSAAIVMAMGPIWAPAPVSTEVLAPPMREAEHAEILAATDATSVTPPTTAPPVPTSLPPEPELIIVEVHRRVPAAAPGSPATAPIVSDPGSPATRSAAAAPVAGAPPAVVSAPAQTPARPAPPGPGAAAPAAPTPAPTPQAAPTPAPPPPPAPTAPPRTSSSG